MAEWKPFMKKKMSELSPQEQEEKRQYYRDWGAGRKKKQAEGPPPAEKKSTKKVLKKESVWKGRSGNGKVQAGDLLGNDKVPDHVKDKIREACEVQGATDNAVHKAGSTIKNHQGSDCNKSQSTTIPLAGTLDLSALIEAIRKEQPGTASGPTTRMEVLVVPQEDGVAVWDITNDLATMNLLLKRNNETLARVETLLQQVVKALVETQ